MPTYEYECSGCSTRFEVVQPITAAPLEKCESCGEKVTRIIGLGGGVIFKGSGFYATDYRSEQYKKEAKREKDAAGTGKNDGAGTGKKDSPGTGKQDDSSAGRQDGAGTKNKDGAGTDKKGSAGTDKEATSRGTGTGGESGE